VNRRDHDVSIRYPGFALSLSVVAAATVITACAVPAGFSRCSCARGAGLSSPGRRGCSAPTANRGVDGADVTVRVHGEMGARSAAAPLQAGELNQSGRTRKVASLVEPGLNEPSDNKEEIMPVPRQPSHFCDLRRDLFFSAVRQPSANTSAGVRVHARLYTRHEGPGFFLLVAAGEQMGADRSSRDRGGGAQPRT